MCGGQVWGVYNKWIRRESVLCVTFAELLQEALFGLFQQARRAVGSRVPNHLGEQSATADDGVAIGSAGRRNRPVSVEEASTEALGGTRGVE